MKRPHCYVSVNNELIGVRHFEAQCFEHSEDSSYLHFLMFLSNKNVLFTLRFEIVAKVPIGARKKEQKTAKGPPNRARPLVFARGVPVQTVLKRPTLYTAAVFIR